AWSRELAVTSLAARLPRVPVWETALVPRTPAPAASCFFCDQEIVMTPRRQKNGRVVPSPEPLRVANPNAAGIDVNAAVHWVAVPPDHVPPKPTAEGSATNPPPHVRRFGACTADLELLADWLQQCGITSVAMESTGVYWIPLFELLERRG